MLQEAESKNNRGNICQPQRPPRSPFYFERQRLNELFTEAVRYPLVVVNAGAGYGKTSALHDFAEEYQAVTLWMQLSERDNVRTRFWENVTHFLTQHNAPLAKAAWKLGFPDSKEKLAKFMVLTRDLVEMKRRIIVFDDFHNIVEPSVIRFIEECVLHNMPPGTSVFLISRSTPRINYTGLDSRGLIFNISENDLRFNEAELALYFKRLGMKHKPENLREIMEDTRGWTFAINLIAQSYHKAPGYGGYLRSAMKTNIFNLMQTEIWDCISVALQKFLVCLSLIDHLSIDLISLLAGGDSELIAELEKQNAYIRKDSYINAYMIHPLFLEFLSEKQDLLPEELKRETYSSAAEWCNRNGFKIDALSYYERIGDYASIVSISAALPAQVPEDIAKFTSGILDRAPAEAADTVEFLAATHLSAYICQGLWQKSTELAEYYEAKFLKLPVSDPFRKLSLCGVYFCRAYLRGLMCLTDNCYDFDLYVENFCKNLTDLYNFQKFANYFPGSWISVVGSSRKGAPLEYIDTLGRTSALMAKYFSGRKTGKIELARGELKFYQGNLRAAEPFINNALELAVENRQHEIVNRALFYILRLCVAQGDYPKAEQVIKKIKAQLDEGDYNNRFINFDISFSWFYYILGMPEKAPEWLKEGFSPYGHAAFIENFANQIKARLCYVSRQYSPLLSYIAEMKQRESFLYGRVEMLAMEACVHYKLKDKTKALASLLEAYETAAPNEILMPFIELGKDMRSLSAMAIKEGGIPGPWLEAINRKASTYAKRQAHISAEYKQANRIPDGIILSAREAEILTDLSHGLSRSEIALNRGLSINTVKMLIKNIFFKAGAENLADLIRIAVVEKII